MWKDSLPLWKHPDFRLIYGALFISGIGDGISKIALLSLSFKLTGSPAAMGMVFVCLTLPGIFSGVLSGALADRLSKKSLMITSNILLGFTALGYVLAAHYRSITLVYVLSFFLGSFFSFAGGPFRAYLPDIFPEEKLSRVNAYITSIESLSMLIGPALGGAILVIGSVKLAFLIDAGTFFIAAALFWFLPTSIPRMAEGVVNVGVIVRDIKSGVAYVFNSGGHRFIMVFFMLVFGIYCISGGLLMPLCEDVLAELNSMKGSTALAIIQASFGLGGLISTFFIPILIKKTGCLNIIIAGALLCVVELWAFGFITNIYVMAAITTVTAASAPMLMVPLFTFLQENTKPRFIGRVMGALDTLIVSVISVSFALGGIMANTLGLKKIFVITGGIMLLFTLMVPLLPGYKVLRRIERDDE